MDRAISELRDERDRAARETLVLESWKCARTSVVWAIEAMLANSSQATTALGWLLRQIEALPAGEEKEEAMAKVLDLSFAIAALARAEARRNVVVPFPRAADPFSVERHEVSAPAGTVVPIHPLADGRSRPKREG